MEDARAIAHLLYDSWVAAYEGLLPEELLAGMSVIERQRELEAAFEAPKPAGAIRLVAELDGNLVGFVNAGVPQLGDPAKSLASVAAQPRVGELAVLYVAPTHWRMGVGRALARAAIRRLRADGCTQVHAWVVDGNEPAFGFFEAQGWTRSEVRRREVVDGHIIRQTRMDLESVG